MNPSIGKTHATIRRDARHPFALLSALAFAGLLLAAPAWAAPCCDYCDGEPQDDPACWSVCVRCDNHGYECVRDSDCGPLQECVNGWCSYEPDIDDPSYHPGDECTSKADCGPFQKCVNGWCVSDSPEP